MTSATPREILDELKRFPLHELDGGGRAADFDGLERFFERVLSLLTHADQTVRAVALERLKTTFWIEEMLVVRGLGTRRVEIDQRLPRVLAAIRDVFMFECFMYHLPNVIQDDEGLKQLVRDWLQGIDERIPAITPAQIRRCRMVFKLEDVDLIAALDEEDIEARASTAARLGEEILAGQRSFQDVIAVITEKDLERPGVAGPFYSAIQFDLGSVAPDFDFRGWMLDLIERRSGPEPELGSFLGIDFHAHEQLAGDPRAIRKLIEIGQLGLAIETATELRAPIPELRELLIELGHHPEPEVVRRIGWHLAHEYAIPHDSAVAQGFVEYRRLPEADLFIMRAPHELRGPFGVVLHTRPGEPALPADTAWRVIDQVCPPAVRGVLVENSFDHKVAPFSVGQNLMYQFERALVVFDDSVTGPWAKIHVGWRGPDGDWAV